MKKATSVLRTVGSFLSTFLVTLVALVAVASVLLKLAGFSLFTVETDSMAPLYPTDALVIVKEVDPATIKAGDVITYVLNEDGVLVTHRVMAVNTSSESFITKGDANQTDDPLPVRFENVVGKVMIGFPKLGAPLRALVAEENRPYVIGGMVAIVVLSLAWDIVVARRKKRVAVAEQPAEEKSEE